MIQSHSSLQAFEQCPRKYYYHYINPTTETGPGIIEAFLGSRVHKSLEALYKARMQGEAWSVDRLLDHYRGEWKENYDPKEVACYKKGQTPAAVRRIGENCLIKYHARHAPFDTGTTIAIEQRLRFSLNGDNRCQLTGFIDRLSKRADGTVEIHDYKTNSKLPSQAQQDADRQLALYQLGVQKLWPQFRKVELVWHFLRFDTEIRSTRTPLQLKVLKQQTTELMDDIESRGKQEDRFEPRRGKLCSWCEYQNHCPLFRHQSKVDAMPADQYRKEPAAKLITRHVKLTERINGLKEQADDLNTQRGAVEQALIAYAHKHHLTQLASKTHEAFVEEKIAVSFPTKTGDDEANAELEAKLRRSSFWDRVCGLNLSTLKKLWSTPAEAPPRLRRMLEPFVEESTKTTVKVKERS